MRIIRRITILATIATSAIWAVCGVIAQEATPTEREGFRDQLKVLANVASKVLAEHELEFDVVSDDHLLTINHRIREYTVHWRGRGGGWSQETRTAIGPDHRGFRMVVIMLRGPYGGAWVRPEVALDNYSLGAMLDLPYYKLRGSTLTLPHVDANLQVNIFHGDECDLTPVIAVHKALLQTVVKQKWMDAPQVSPARTGLLSTELLSDDPQTRCDAFYRLFGAPLSNDEDFILYGKTTDQIRALLGTPTGVTRLEHAEVEWLHVTYHFDVYPTRAPDAERRAWQEGWRYAPAMYFRDGIAVSTERMMRELELLKYPVPPEHLRFNPGGSFP